MDKNPISFLQEYFVKLKIQPEYKVINQKIGTHINEFTIRLDCGNAWAPVEQTGSSKKEAKIKAAEIMRKKVLSSEGIIEDIDGNEKSNCVIKSDDINWIGKLLELVVGYNENHPTFNCSNITGASHNPTFTVTCSYKNLSVEALGKTKKEAKNLAAKLMYEKLQNISNCTSVSNKLVVGNKDKSLVVKTDKLEIDNYLDLILSDVKKKDLVDISSTMRAKKLYTELSPKQLQMCTLDENIEFTKYYMHLQNYINNKSYSNQLTDINTRLSEIHESCHKLYSSWDDGYCFDKEKPMKLFEKLLNELNIYYSVKSEKIKNGYRFMIKLNTKPCAIEFGLGKDAKQAEVIAVMQITRTLSIVLG